MNEKEKVALAAAVVGGYVLGRTKKGRLALSIATYLAGRRFGLEPRQLAAEGMRRLGEIPQFADLQEQLRGEVLQAGRQAVAAAADRGMSTLAGAISDRTARLGEIADEEDEGSTRRKRKTRSTRKRKSRRPSTKKTRPRKKKRKKKRKSRRPSTRKKRRRKSLKRRRGRSGAAARRDRHGPGGHPRQPHLRRPPPPAQ